jgi:hypothetical protein
MFSQMDTIVSITSIPSRFKHLPDVVKNLTRQGVEVWVSIPHTYNRWPDTKVEVPLGLSDIPGVRVVRCKDYGPGTVYFGPLDGEASAHTLVAVDDDTAYPVHMTKVFEMMMGRQKGVWCTSGFRIPEYLERGGVGVPRYDGEEVDVAEGYGGVAVPVDCLERCKADFVRMYKTYTYNDDINLSNLMARMGVPRRSICCRTLNLAMIQQYQFGMEDDALWRNDGDNGHFLNNQKTFKTLRESGEYYFKEWQSGIASSSTMN